MCFCSVHAQQELSLSDAIGLTLENNFQIRLADRQAEIAQNNNAWGQAGALPRFDLNGNFNYNITDNSENPTSFIQEELVSTGLTYGASVNWTLFDGFGMFVQKDRLELLEALSEGNSAVVIENAIQATILAYFNAQLQAEKKEVLMNVIALSEDRLKYEETKKELGASTTFETLQFQNAILTDSTSLLTQELAYDNAIRNLNLLMVQSLDTQWKLTSPLEQTDADYQLESLIAKANADNNTLRNQMVNQLISAKDLKLAQAAMYPVVGFNAGYNNTANTFEAGDLSGDGRTLNYFAQFTLSFNLFDGGRTRRAIKNARINEEITNLSMGELKFNVENELKNTFRLFEAQKQIEDLSEKSVENSQRNLQIAEERFKTGAINSFNYRDAQVAYLRSASNLLEAQYNALTSKTALVRLTGGLVSENP